MFVIAQLPFVDLRSFVHDPSTRRLMKPQWPIPVIGYEFVRRFGVVRRNPQGSLLGWSGEEYYCHADKAITFAESPTRSTAFRVHPCYRRLITDGIVGRVEVGFRARDAADYVAAAEAICGIRVSVGKGPVRELRRASPSVAALYARSTTALSLGDGHRAGLVLPGAPLVVVERRAPAKDELRADGTQEMAIEHQWYGSEGTSAALWLLEQRAGASRWLVRDARTHAMRLHCEYEAFAAILRACIRGQVLPHESPELTDYLYGRARRLLRANFKGMPQGTLLESVAAARRSFTQSDLASLEQVFAKVSASLRRLVEEAAYASKEVDPALGGSGPAKYLINVEAGGTVTVNEQSWKFENSKVSGVFGNNAKIENSQFGDRSGELVVDLSDLAAALLRQLSELRQEGADVEESIEFAEVVAEEAAKPELNKRRIRTMISNIAGSVKELGQAALPVMQTVEGIDKLLQ